MKKSILCSGCGQQIAEFDDQTNSIVYTVANGSRFTAPAGQTANFSCAKCGRKTQIFARSGLVFGIDPEDCRLRRNPRLNDGGALICPKCGHEFGSFSHKTGDACPFCSMRKSAADLFAKL